MSQSQIAGRLSLPGRGVGIRRPAFPAVEVKQRSEAQGKNSTMSMSKGELAKRMVLALIGVAVFVLAAQSGRVKRPLDVRAQSPLPTELTATAVFTTTPGPTVSPTPTKAKRAVNEITAPTSSDAISGGTDIVGTALVDAFQRYDVHISPAGREDWQWLITSFAIIHDAPLYRLDTTRFPDGFYDLRVRAIANDGTYTESFVRGVEIRNANPPTPTPNPEVTATPVSPLPTPTPAVRSRIPGGQGFYAPDSGAILDGEVTIRATVNGTREQRFERYELAISPAGLEKWSWLHGGREQVWQNEIYRLDTTEFADGRYDLRLRIVYEDGNYSEYYLRNLTFANAGTPQVVLAPPVGILSPKSGTQAFGVVEFVGTVPEAELLRWELSWSPGQREQWSFLVGGDQPLTEGVIASLDLSRLPPGQYDFRLRIVRSDYNYTDYYVRDLQLQPDP